MCMVVLEIFWCIMCVFGWGMEGCLVKVIGVIDKFVVDVIMECRKEFVFLKF